MKAASPRATETYWLVRTLTATGPTHVTSNAGQWLKAFDAGTIAAAIEADILDKRKSFLSVGDSGTLWFARREATIKDPALAELDTLATSAIKAIRTLLEKGDDGDELDARLLGGAAELCWTAIASPAWNRGSRIVGDQRHGAITALIALADDSRTRRTSPHGVTPARSRLTALQATLASIGEWETSDL